MGVLGLWPAQALADLDWQVVETTPGEPTERVRNPAPEIRIRVTGEPAPRAADKDQFRLELAPADNPMRLKGVTPTRLTPFHLSSDTLAIAVLVEGHQFYFGNDSYAQGAPTITEDGVRVLTPVSPGVFAVIRDALDAPAGDPDDIPTTISGASDNPGSRGALLVYSVGVDVRYQMGPLDQLQGDKLGTQEMQRGKVSRDLAEGLRASLAQLRRASATRRVLFLISDGFDTGSIDELRGLRRDFDREGIDIFAFHLEAGSKYIAGDDSQRNQQVMRALGQGGNGAYYPVRDNAALSKKIADAIGVINSSFYLTFPGSVENPRTRARSGFDWNGQEHEVLLFRNDEQVGEQGRTIEMSPVWGQARPASRWWLWLVIPLGGAALVGLLVALTRKRPAAPAPQPAAVAAPAPAPGPIKPAAAPSSATMAITLDDTPVVGWLVPINGPQQFKTFKLFAGVTKVGNAPGAHIFIDDGYMSGEHAHVAMSPSGFTLIDNGSTNGTYVNERRVQRHELIDNDVIKFGKTDCKFKTINTDA